jgi:hypothetical protein
MPNEQIFTKKLLNLKDKLEKLTITQGMEALSVSAGMPFSLMLSVTTSSIK